MYPACRAYPQVGEGTRVRTTRDLEKIEHRVATVVNLINYNAGNVVPLIAKDLSSPAAEHELRLLPRLYEKSDILLFWFPHTCGEDED